MADGWIENKGSMPSSLRGKRIFVRLRCGIMPEQSWPAEGGTRWTLEKDKDGNSRPFDILHWKEAK